MIEIVGLQKVIDQRTVLDLPSLRVEAGEIAALVGPAGSGKWTLFALGLITGLAIGLVVAARGHGSDRPA